MIFDSQRVLIVDDDHLVADTLGLIFKRSGYNALTCYSADQALTQAREFQPNLLLCDITMPGRDGLALAQDVVSELPSCRILVLTGFQGNLHRVREHTDRFEKPVGLLSKPCQPAELLREANAMLANA
ncbi:MAG TPA: response regulator [Edaphobacter sp.]|jgi:CheY-like chemotaxis protein|nr:response regulator [Edaphobacter sp.]